MQKPENIILLQISIEIFAFYNLCHSNIDMSVYRLQIGILKLERLRLGHSINPTHYEDDRLITSSYNYQRPKSVLWEAISQRLPKHNILNKKIVGISRTIKHTHQVADIKQLLYQKEVTSNSERRPWSIREVFCKWMQKIYFYWLRDWDIHQIK